MLRLQAKKRRLIQQSALSDGDAGSGRLQADDLVDLFQR